MNTSLTIEQLQMLTTWRQHTHAEFVLKDPAAALATMTDNPYVVVVPAGMAAVGRNEVFEFYAEQFLPQNPPDLELISLSLVCGQDRIVEEMVLRFTHSVRMDWMLPDVQPTGRRAELPLVAVVGFQNGKVASEHVYWDQATALSQLGLLDEPIAATGVGSAIRILRLMGRN